MRRSTSATPRPVPASARARSRQVCRRASACSGGADPGPRGVCRANVLAAIDVAVRRLPAVAVIGKRVRPEQNRQSRTAHGRRERPNRREPMPHFERLFCLAPRGARASQPASFWSSWAARRRRRRRRRPPPRPSPEPVAVAPARRRQPELTPGAGQGAGAEARDRGGRPAPERRRSRRSRNARQGAGGRRRPTSSPGSCWTRSRPIRRRNSAACSSATPCSATTRCRSSPSSTWATASASTSWPSTTTSPTRAGSRPGR